MKSELEEICNKIIESEQIGRNERYRIYEEDLNLIYNGLDTEQKKIFEKIFEIHCDMMAETEMEYLKAGLKLGIKFAMEAIFS